MGRVGDAEVHQAFVEFRQKESDKCMSAQCIYCQSVRAKNTSRQRAHLIECPNFLAAMKEHNPENPLLQESLNGPPPEQGTPGGGGGSGSGGGSGGAGAGGRPSISGASGTPQSTPKTVKKRDHETMTNGGGSTGFQGGASSGFGGLGIGGMWGGHNTQGMVPRPQLERDFQMSLQVNPKIGVGPTIWGQKGWMSFVSGHWNGRWGKGTVVPGGNTTTTSAPDLSTKTESTLLLQTHDTPVANIHLRTDGWLVGPRDVLEKLEDPAQADDIDPKSYCWRMYLRMETGDSRHLSLNTGMWIGSGVRRGMEIIYDAYRIV